MMTESNIPIRNIFYMLAYAFRELTRDNYSRVAEEDFEGAEDLLAEILSIGISSQVKQGLYREYMPRTEDLPGLRGKLSLSGTIADRFRQKPLLCCEFDELTEDNPYNRILKTTADYLARHPRVASARKQKLQRLLPHFARVALLPHRAFPWSRLVFQRNNRTYEFLIELCRFVWDNLLLSETEGTRKTGIFSDKQKLHALYENFIRAYYNRHYPALHAQKKGIAWDLDPGVERPSALPQMETDITLIHGEKTLIIDAKFYGRAMQEQWGKETFHSANLYQIFAYVKNEDRARTGNVSGMLLYAKTKDGAAPDDEFSIAGNRFEVRTLDLSGDFELIKARLDGIAEKHFPDVKKKE